MDFDFILFDRIEKIKQINKQYNLESKAYISFSGGKDSTILHYLIDLALPGNRIPRVFINTGLEFLEIVKFVKDLASKDDRIIIINAGQNVRKMLETYGYPFKSKEHSQKVAIYQSSGLCKTTLDYLTKDNGFGCPKKLAYQFSEEFNLKISDKCCYKMKKEPIAKWQKESGKTITLTGMRRAEKGNRTRLACIVTDKNDQLKKFHPLAPVDNNFMEQFIQKYNIKLCALYYEPYNFKRTGCVGCPYNRDLAQDLKLLREKLPAAYKQANIIWKPVYNEYKRINYRLKDLKEYKQISIFDILEQEKRK